VKNSSRQILIINTGGTISSVKTPKGYEPKAHFVEHALRAMPVLKHPEMPKIDVLEYNPLLDSSNMSLADWNLIASDIKKHYHDYDGFVILHGTDTMAYTASALSFMLENLAKPVVITGSQIPLSEIRNDATENLITSLWLAATAPLYEVVIYFNHRLLRGNRAQKVSATQFSAFDSPNFPPLATVGIDIKLEKELLLPKPHTPFHLQAIDSHFIANFRLFPGFATEILIDLLQLPKLKGLIIETYGTGNAPNQNPAFLAALQSATDRGIVIVNCSQCQQGRVEMSQYATGYALKEIGLVSGYDMTPEAAHCKLLYLFSKAPDVQWIKEKMAENRVGELSH